MNKYLITPIIFIFLACHAGSAEKDKTTYTEGDTIATEDNSVALIETPEPAPKEEVTPPDTFCYVLTEGEQNKNINAVRIVLLPDNKIAGELKYLTYSQPPAVGNLKGSIKDNIITADWTFIKNDTNFYSIPVAFKMTKSAIFQKPSKVDENGKPYLPENGEYRFEFKKVGCEYYPK